ncbi:TlpA family protein disulfide reductase [Natronoflexus pectinivorans]|uniref:Thiol-disulfide isomerase/thioredoxin n=1 Tax=Natronoflexus pectinivorans TaxID=682526 RepID=A0A4R2GMI2_9BACT|nr:TlpA disulfide reductase family protein [Natronoflexus pectinivorans]TCO10494.1 thiol-disulfide isomerase/thioredoxin [Natronoflexus pectinivorans]
MIKCFLQTILIVVAGLSLTSHTIIKNPKHGFSNSQILQLTGIEILDTTTILHFHAIYTPGWWINLNEKYYISDVESDEKLFVKASDGIPFNERFTMPESGEVSFKAYFPPIGSGVERIDFTAEDLDRAWTIFDIELNPQSQPEWMQMFGGNWFRPASGNWELGVYNGQIIYQQKIWILNDVELSDGFFQFNVDSEGDIKTIFAHINEDDNILAGFSRSALQEYVRIEKLAAAELEKDDALFELPIFNLDSVKFTGLLKDYTPRVGSFVFTIYVNNILTGDQESYTSSVLPDGTFEIMIPLYYPHEVYVRSEFYSASLFLEPGKDVLVMFDLSSRYESVLYMGENARLIRELSGFNVHQNFNYREVESKILGMSHMDFKAYCDSVKKVTQQFFEEYARVNNLSAKAIQVRELDFIYQFLSIALEYHWTFENAYRQKHNIPRTQRELPVKIPVAEIDFYDFMTDEIIHNPLALLSDGYNSFVNRIKHNRILTQNEGADCYSQARIMQLLLESGFEFTEEELSMIDLMKKLEDESFLADMLPYSVEDVQNFVNKNEEYIEGFLAQNEYSGIFNLPDFCSYLLEQGIPVSPEEKILVAQVEEFQNSDKYNEMNDTWEQVNNFYSGYAHLTDMAITYHQYSRRLTHLNSFFGIELGLVTDIMYSQDILRRIVSQMTPLTDSDVERIQANISDPFIKEYLAVSNQSVIDKIELNKLTSVHNIQEVPDTDLENVFDAIISKYKGKVVYVDFWATWCGPCRSGMTRIIPLKEELSDEDIVFVYITNPSSPKNAWKNMIAEIKGDHYRVSNEEWEVFRNRFDITGIPHYVLVDKNGEVVNPKVQFGISNNDLKNLFMKYLN